MSILFKLTPIEPEMSAGEMPEEVAQQLYQAKPMPNIDLVELDRMIAKACFGIDDFDEIVKWWKENEMGKRWKEKRKRDEHLDD